MKEDVTELRQRIPVLEERSRQIALQMTALQRQVVMVEKVLLRDKKELLNLNQALFLATKGAKLARLAWADSPVPDLSMRLGLSGFTTASPTRCPLPFDVNLEADTVDWYIVEEAPCAKES